MKPRKRSILLAMIASVAAHLAAAALLLEQNDEWAIQRRYMSLETLATLGENGEVRLPAIAN